VKEKNKFRVDCGVWLPKDTNFEYHEKNNCLHIEMPYPSGVIRIYFADPEEEDTLSLSEFRGRIMAALGVEEK